MPQASRSGQRAAQPQEVADATPVKELSQSQKVSSRGWTISLVIGDTLCFLIFASLGAYQHGEGFNLGYNILVAVPFVVAWFLVTPWIGAFRADLVAKPSKMLVYTVLSWLATWPVAMLLRWLLVDRVKVSPTTFSSFLAFAIVALIVNTVLLLLWRWSFALITKLRKGGI